MVIFPARTSAPVHATPAHRAVDESAVKSREPSRPVFNRGETARTQASRIDRMPGVHVTQAQQEQWQALTNTGRRALQAWEGARPGGYPIQAPRFEMLRGAPAVSDQVWTAHKQPDGTLDISSLAFPRQSPHLRVIPSDSLTRPATYILDGKTIGPHSSLRDLKMANLLAETLDLAI